MKKLLGFSFFGLLVGCAVDGRFSEVEEGMGFPGYASGSSAAVGGADASGGETGTGNSSSTGGADNSGGSPANTGGGTSTGGTPGSGGTPASGGAGSGGAEPAEPETIFDGTGVAIADGSNDVGIQGFFFILEDSVDDGTLVTHPYMTFSDLDSDTGTTGEPSSFDTSTLACVSGTITLVTADDGLPCNDEYPCQYTAQWGGGIGLTLNEDSGGSMPWDAAAAGVSGFEFEITGSTGGAQLRFYVLDSAGEQFCRDIAPGDTETISLDTLQHNCWDPDDGVELDITDIETITWQMAADTSSSHNVTAFCVGHLGIF